MFYSFSQVIGLGFGSCHGGPLSCAWRNTMAMAVMESYPECQAKHEGGLAN